MITVTGPDWPSIRELRTALAAAPESGTFHAGGTKILATEQLRRFVGAGLRVPEYTTTLRVAHDWLLSGDTILARKENHSQGRDIIIATGGYGALGRLGRQQASRWQGREWWCKFVPSTEEWRIHVFDGRVIGRGKKRYQEIIYGREPNPATPIRSRRNGWLMQHDLEPTDAARDAARGAIAALGYLYGAVDMLVTRTGIVVLEANRLPAMDTYTRDAYVRAIRRYVGGRKIPRSEPARPYEGYEIL